MKSYDVIVLGLGAMGSAATYQLAKKGKKVLGIDQFSPPHTMGSTHGDTRVTRQAIGEGEEYVPIVLRSYEIWRELEKETGKDLLTTCGGIIMMRTSEGEHHGKKFFQRTIDTANQYHIRHEELDFSQISKRFPQFILNRNEHAYYEYEAGFLRPENCVSAHLQMANKYGAELKINEKVLSVTPKGNDRVVVKTSLGEYEAERLIISAGAWITEFLDEKYKAFFKVCRQVVTWFDVPDIKPFLPDHFPIFLWEVGDQNEDAIYGFPAINGPGGGIKIANDQFSDEVHPDSINRMVSEAEKKHMYERYIHPNFKGITDKVVRTAVCMFTVTPDYNFVIDTLPEHPQVIVTSPCSGHGFKHSAAIGEILAQLASEGKTTFNISKMGFNRFLT